MEAHSDSPIGLPQDIPGRLGGSQVSFEVHTIEANGIVTGRKVKDKPTITSLTDFNHIASIAYFAASRGDPFANEALLRVEAAMSRTATTLAELERQVDQAMDGKTRISLGVSRNPRSYQLTIAHYGSQMADLIMTYDKLVVKIRNAHFHNRLGTKPAKKLIEQGRKTVRASLMALASWRFTNVTFEDLRQLNQLAQEAIAKLVSSRFLDLSEYEGDWGKVAEYYAVIRAEPRFGPARRTSLSSNPIDNPLPPTETTESPDTERGAVPDDSDKTTEPDNA